MQKKVTLFVNDFTPGKEGVSNAINILLTHLRNDPSLNITLHEISRSSRVKFSPSHISYPLFFLPLGTLVTKYLERKSDLIHICGSLTGRIYMKMLNRQPILLTNASAIQEGRVKECKQHWGKLTKVVVECHRDQARVINYGLDPHKVSMIYPAVNTAHLSYHRPPDRFTVGFASSPISNHNSSIKNRGVDLLLSAARELPDVDFVLLWRRKHYPALRQLIPNRMTDNISVTNCILPDMNTFYATIHCTILPSTVIDNCKPCPNSIMESLAAGKPVLVSDNVGIADLVTQSGCGLVFEPEPDDIIAKINALRHDYCAYQSKCRPTAEQYFSVSRFVNEYTLLYDQLLLP